MALPLIRIIAGVGARLAVGAGRFARLAGRSAGRIDDIFGATGPSINVPPIHLAPIAFDVKLHGFKELQEALRLLPQNIAANVQRNATRAAAAAFRDAVRETAPVRTGLLKASVVVNKRRSPPNVVTYGVRLKPGKKQKYGNTAANRRLRRVGKRFDVEGPAFYGRFLEYGTSKMRARPFMRPAFGPNVNRALDAFKARMRAGIDREVAKLPRYRG